MTEGTTAADLAFARYQTSGRPEDLAEVFDGCAPKLLLLANHVAGDSGVAEDLVQLTFLKAIEGAARFEAGRPVQPWLVGILVREAKKQKRQAARTTDRDRLGDLGGERVPIEVAEMREFQEALTKALDDLPPKYREVLTLRLIHGLTPTEIGHARGVSPETIKTRIKRGTERLKALLPPSFATALVALAATGAGLAAVRETVLGAATAAAETVVATAGANAAAEAATQATEIASNAAGSALQTAAASTGAKTLVAGSSAARKALLLAGVGGAAVLGVMSWPSPDDDPLEPLPEIRERIPDPRPERAVLRAPVAEESPEAETAAVDTALSTFSGRVIGESGIGVAGLAIELLRLHPDALIVPVGSLPNWTTEPDFVAGTATTDDLGRFSITGVKPSGVFLAAIDAHGDRIQWRLVDRTPGVRQHVDLGVIRLGRRRVVQGRILDENGMPIVGARLRHAGRRFRGLDEKSLLGRTLACIGTDDFDAEGGIVVPWGESWQLLKVPAWFHALHQHVLARTITTDARGRFTWVTAQAGPVELVVKRDPFATKRISFTVRGERQDVGEFKLRRIGSVQGMVFDEKGDPVTNAEVMLAKYRPKARSHPTRVITTTNDEGVFHAAWSHPDRLFVVVRKRAGEPWHIDGPTSPAERIKIAMPRSFDVFLRVVARHGSKLTPLPERPVLRLVPAQTDAKRATGILTMHQLGCIEPLLLSGRRSRTDNGEEKISGVPSGDWILMISARGYGAKAMPLRIRGVEQVSVELNPLEPTDVALDNPGFARMDDLPVFARGFDERDRIYEFPVHVGNTDESGVLSLPRSRWRRHAIGTASNELGVFAAVANAGVDRLAIGMPRRGVIDGQITENGQPAAPGSWLLLARPVRPPHEPAVVPDNTVVAPVQIGGLFRLPGLEPGKWRVQAVRPPARLTHPSLLLPVLFPDAGAEPARTHELVAGGELSISFETVVAPDPAGEEEATPQTIHGVVKLRSQTALRTHVGVHTGRGFRWFEPTEDGEFDSGIVPTGPTTVVIVALEPGKRPESDSPKDFIWMHRLGDGQRRIDLELQLLPTTFSLRVGKSKAPGMDLLVSGVVGDSTQGAGAARCQLHARTDPGGWFRLDVPAGTYRITGERNLLGFIDKRVEVTTPASLTLDVTRPFVAAGVASPEDIGVPLPDGSKVEFERLDGGPTEIRRKVLLGRRQRFQVTGLLPGRYRVTVHPALLLASGRILTPEQANIPVPQGVIRFGEDRRQLVLRRPSRQR